MDFYGATYTSGLEQSASNSLPKKCIAEDCCEAMPTRQNNDQFLSVHTFTASNASILTKMSKMA
jgi:hypothetical protein